MSSSIATSVPFAFIGPLMCLMMRARISFQVCTTRGVILVLEMDRHGAQCALIAVADFVEPLVEIQPADHAALQRHVGGFVEARDFSDAVLLFVAVAIFGDGDFHADVADFLEARLRAVGVAIAEIDEEVELHVGSFALDCHGLVES